MEHAVIVGAGHAGVQVADSLRAKDYRGDITLVCDEHVLPYQRPPLSKDFLAGDKNPEALPLRARSFFAANDITLRAGVAVGAIDRTRRTAVLDDGVELPYSALVLATGAAGRVLEAPGVDLAGVHELRTLADAERLRESLTDARSVVVVGAGFIGLEFAATARARGVGVTALEAAARPMGRALSPVMSDYVAQAHRSMGTDLRLGEGLAAVAGRAGAVVAAVSTSGREYPADLVLVGVGVHPRDELARAAGLAVDNGIVVDVHLRTTDPAVYAIGDCVSFPAGPAGHRMRLESVQNATDQGRHVADMIMGGDDPYVGLPWFWSNQGPLRLQIAGLRRPGDSTVVCGDVRSGRFSVLSFRDEQLVAVESLNRPADHMAARRLLPAGAGPRPGEVARPGFSLKDYARQLASTH